MRSSPGQVLIRKDHRFEVFRPRKATFTLLAKYDPLGDLAAAAKSKRVTQREFLLTAMHCLGLNRQEFAIRIGATKKGLDKWLAQTDSSDYHAMSPLVWKFVAEVVHKDAPGSFSL